MLFAQSSESLQSALGKKPHLSLVLSGGGARGFAHIGVLEVLDSAHIPIDLLVGTSMGAIIGGLYAAGYTPKELAKLAENTNWIDVFNLSDDSHRPERSFAKKDEKVSLLSLRFNGFFKPVLPQAISSGQRLTMLLNSLVINSSYGSEDDFLHNLRLPLVVLATDIVTGTRRIMTHGDLTSAIRASATVPLRFYPLVHDSALLVDGGLLSNVPIDVAKDSAGSEIVIASNTTAELRNRSEIESPWDVADQVITLMMRKENLAQMQRADLVMTPELEHGTPDDFQKVDLYIEAGKAAARKALPRLLELLSHSSTPAQQIQSAPDTNLLPELSTIHVYGNSNLSSDSLRASFSGALGKALTNSSYKKNIEVPLLAYLRRHGYSLARIDSVRLNQRLQRADLFLDEGRIAKIQVKGLNSVQQNLVLRELTLAPGDIFRAEAGERGLRNLTATGYFSFASLELIHSPDWKGTQFYERSDTTLPQIIDPSVSPTATSLQVTVEERATNVLRLAALADNEFGAQFSMQYANENLFGFGTEFSLTGGIGGLSRYAIAQISTPQLFLSFTTFDLGLYSGFKDISVYSLTPNIPTGKISAHVEDVVREIRDIGGRLRLGGEVGRLALLTGEIRIERQRSYSTLSRKIVDPSALLTALKGELTIDSRDDASYPHTGTLLQGNYEVGTGFLGGSERYTKIYALFEPTLPVSRLHTFIPKIAIGIGDRTLPRLEQFDLGGIENFYGLNAYGLRGKQMAQGSLTYQVAIPDALFFPTYVSFRYDLGAMWVEPESIKFEDFVHGVGAQIGFKTPIGLARFAIGENFRFAKDKEKPLLLNTPIFYFSIGANL
ncbi:MAG: patatin-like phospholipase family protein [Bacteroidota bacterium]|nr:patatin-like phospholipase family protein [Bacteroidota bacterium]